MAHWLRRTVVLLIAVLATAAIGVVPAEAGGPTSVLLSAPNIPKVVAAGYEDKSYEELQQLVEMVEFRSAPSGEDHAVGNFIRATWLIHDMMVWRLDVIYPDAPGGPWIATTDDRNGTGRMSQSPVWHRATDDVKLVKLLVSLGLLGGERGDRGSGGPTSMPQSAPSVAEEPAAPPVQQATETVKAGQGALSGWRWIIPGVLLGAVIALLAVRLVPKRGRWELLDAD